MEQIVGFARRLDPGLTDRDFAEAAERLDGWGDGVFASFGLGAEGIAELRARFAACPEPDHHYVLVRMTSCWVARVIAT